MNIKQLLRSYGFLITVLFSSTANSAAYQLYELGTPIIGTAGVGQAAVAEDASTSYFNPAGMSKIISTELMLGSQIMIPHNKFSKHDATTITGNDGGNAGALTPGMDIYYVYNFSPKFRFGIALTAPYGGELDYNDGWVGRFVVQTVTFYTININPSVSYEFNKYLSLGAGVAVEYMNLQQTIALPYVADNDGQVKISANDTAAGFNVGLMITPYETTRIGITYRSQIKHNLNGTLTFLKIPNRPDVSTQMIMPQNVIVSLQQNWEKIYFLAEAGWANWSKMQDTILNVRGYSAVTPLNWKDTYRLGVGSKYKFTQKFLMQAGVSYDSSPTSTALRQPDLPMDRQIRAGIGIMYDLIKQATLAVSYEYLSLGRASINNTTSSGTLSGYYPTNYANTFQISINIAI